MKRIVFPFLLLIALISLGAFGYAKDFEFSSEQGDFAKFFSNAIITDPISGNAVVMFGDAEINNSVDGDLAVLFGNATVNAPVGGDVTTIFGNLRVNSSVGGDVVDVMGQSTLTEKANIGGDFVTVGEAIKEQGFVVGGDIQQTNIGFLSGFNFSGLLIALGILWAVFLFITGTIFSIVGNRWFTNMVYGMTDKMGKKFGIGFLVLLGLVILIPILAITIAGPFLLVFILLMSEAIVCAWIGRMLIRVFSPDSGYIRFAQFLTGFVILVCIELAPIIILSKTIGNMFILYVPINMLINVFMGALGFGSMLLTFKDRNKEPFTP